MNIIEVSCRGVEEPRWLTRLRTFGEHVLERLDIDGWEVSLLLCDDGVITELNSRYRGKDTATDVLSFPQGWFGLPRENGRGPKPAGDVVISMETLRRQARQYDTGEEEELKRLLVHGILHLNGMTHDGDDRSMLELQEKILNSLQKETIL